MVFSGARHGLEGREEPGEGGDGGTAQGEDHGQQIVGDKNTEVCDEFNMRLIQFFYENVSSGSHLSTLKKNHLDISLSSLFYMIFENCFVRLGTAAGHNMVGPLRQYRQCTAIAGGWMHYGQYTAV